MVYTVKTRDNCMRYRGISQKLQCPVPYKPWHTVVSLWDTVVSLWDTVVGLWDTVVSL